jgi:hypothetical protein
MLSQRRQWDESRRTQIRHERALYEPDEPSPKRMPPGWLEWLDFVDPDSSLAILVVAGAISIVFVIWYCISLIVLAPEFLSELLLDGVFSAALAKNRLRQNQGSLLLDALVLCISGRDLTAPRTASDLHRRSHPPLTQR